MTSVTGVTAAAATPVLLGPHGVPNATFPAGTPYQLSISTANVDPIVFGGPHHSRAVARAFDPSRDNSGASLSWNGRLSAVAAGSAPRGCPGYKLSLALARSLVAAFAPSRDATPVPLSTGTVADAVEVAPHLLQQASSVATATGTGAVASVAGRAAATAASMSSKMSARAAQAAAKLEVASRVPRALDRFAFFIWMALCLGGLGALVSNGLRAVSLRYAHYLGAQVLVSVAFITANGWLFVQAQMLAALAYILIFITATCQDAIPVELSRWNRPAAPPSPAAAKKGKAKVDASAGVDAAKVAPPARTSLCSTGPFYSCVAWALWAALAALTTSIHIFFGNVPTQQLVANSFYSIGAGLGIASIVRFYRQSRAGVLGPVLAGTELTTPLDANASQADKDAHAEARSLASAPLLGCVSVHTHLLQPLLRPP